MKNLLIVFFILTLILCVVLFPFKTRLMGHFNLLTLKGYYSFKIWRIKLLCGMIERDENGEFKITNANNVLKGEYNKPFVKNLAKEIIARLDIKKIEIFFTGGFVDDSFSSAMLCGTISSSVRALYSYLSQKYDDVKLYEDINPTYNESNLELTFDIVVSVSLIKLVGAVLKSNSKSKKEEIKNEG